MILILTYNLPLSIFLRYYLKIPNIECFLKKQIYSLSVVHNHLLFCKLRPSKIASFFVKF